MPKPSTARFYQVFRFDGEVAGRLIAKLKPRQVQIAALIVHGHPFTEICTRLGMPLQTFRNNLVRIRRRLQAKETWGIARVWYAAAMVGRLPYINPDLLTTEYEVVKADIIRKWAEANYPRRQAAEIGDDLIAVAEWKQQGTAFELKVLRELFPEDHGELGAPTSKMDPIIKMEEPHESDESVDVQG